MLTLEERRLIFQYCWDHPVASCVPCHAEYRLPGLAATCSVGFPASARNAVPT